MTGRLGIALLVLSLSLSARADVFDHPVDIDTLSALLKPVTTALDDAQTVHGDFRQLKSLRELPQPLIAEGDFLFARGTGIAWRTRAPFASELLITPDALIQRDGSSEQRIEAAQQPAVRIVASIFLAVFSLDFGRLAEMFELFALPSHDGRWTLGLRPKQAAGSIVDIEVGGTRAGVDAVLLREQGGDRTRIELSDTHMSAAALTPEQRARFEQP